MSPSVARSSKPIRYARSVQSNATLSVNSYVEHHYHVLEHNTPKWPLRPSMKRQLGRAQEREETHPRHKIYEKVTADLSTSEVAGNMYEAPVGAGSAGVRL